MGIFKKFFGYEVDLVCENCGAPNKASVPKGTKVCDFVKSGQFTCDNCGCVSNPKEYKTKWLEK